MRADAEHPDTSHCFRISFMDTNGNVILDRWCSWESPHAHIISPRIVSSRALVGWGCKSQRLSLYIHASNRQSDFAQLLRVGDLMANDLGHLGVWLGDSTVFRSASPVAPFEAMCNVDIFIGKRLA